MGLPSTALSVKKSSFKLKLYNQNHSYVKVKYVTDLFVQNFLLLFKIAVVLYVKILKDYNIHKQLYIFSLYEFYTL